MNYADLKKLETIYIFDVYDYPLFYISQSDNQVKYLHYFIEEKDDGETSWFFSRITNTELRKLINKKFSELSLLRHLLKQKRLNKLVISGGISSLAEKPELDVLDESSPELRFLPEDDFYVEYDHLSDTEFGEEVITEVDPSLFKVVLRDNNNSHDLPVDKFIDLCNFMKKSFKQSVEKIANTLNVQALDPYVNLSISAIEPSSFAVWFKTQDDIFDIATPSMSILSELIEEISDGKKEIIEEKLLLDHIYSVPMLQETNKFLKELKESEYTFSMEFTEKVSRNDRVIDFKKDSYKYIDSIQDILRNRNESVTETVKIHGNLTSINLQRNFFRIDLPEENLLDVDFVSGKFTSALVKLLKSQDKRFIIPSSIEAELLVTSSYNYVDDEGKITYELLTFYQENLSL